MQKPKSFQSQITFMYFKDLQPAAAFFEDVMGFEMVDDQEWARLYRLSGNAYLGAVSGEKAFHQPQEKNAVLVTLAVDDVPGWYEYLKVKGVKILREMQDRKDNQVRCFFFEGPGGYSFEIQEFLKPELAKIFHQ
jgi:catechol 2,3-dioxygenase-like lactoylglutathione lyase family enzyme